MPFSDKVDEVFEELEDHAKRQNPAEPLFSRSGLLLIALTVAAALLIWGGLLLQVDWATVSGVVLFAVVIFLQWRELYGEVKTPSVTYAGWARSGAAAQAKTLEKLYPLDPVALADSEAFLIQRIAAAEEGMVFLVGPLRTLGLAGGLSALLAIGTALENWVPILKDNALFISLYGGFIFGLLLGAERAETGLVQLRINRELVTRAIALQQTGRPLP